MDIKFNSLFNNENNIDIKPTNYYNINKQDDINLDNRIKENSLIINFSEDELNRHNLLNNRNYGNLPVTLISGRPCSTSLCNSNKFCDSGGKVEILKEITLSCDNDFMPQSERPHPKRYLQNMDIESRLKNIDYKTHNCGKKQFKEKDLKSLDCFKDKLINDSVIFKDRGNTKHTGINQQCNIKLNNAIFNNSSKRIDNINW